MVSQTDGARGRELTVGAYQQIGLMAHGFAHQTHQANRALQRLLGWLARVIG